MLRDSALAESIGRAVLAAIHEINPASATTAAAEPQQHSAVRNYAALRSATPSTSTLTSYRMDSSTGGILGPATPSTSTGTSYRMVPLPSVPQRSRFVRKNKACKHYTRDIICLPFSSASTFCIPRGDSRAKLAQDGLIGKISFTSDWSEAQLREEITAIFRKTFGLSMDQSQYLSTIKECKRLMKPNVSSSFLWGGKEVASISSTTLYIGVNTQAYSVKQFILHYLIYFLIYGHYSVRWKQQYMPTAFFLFSI